MKIFRIYLMTLILVFLFVISSGFAEASDLCSQTYPQSGRCIAETDCNRAQIDGYQVNCISSPELCSASNQVCIVSKEEKPTIGAGKSADTLLGDASVLNKTKLSGAGSIPKAINRMISFLIYPLGAFALALYVWAGTLWMTSAGNADRAGKAKSIIVWASLGVLIIFSSYILVQFIFGALK